MKKWITALCGVGLAAASLAATTSSAQAAPTSSCSSTVTGKTFAGAVTVPAGKTCTLKNSRVAGSVILGKGSSLNATDTQIGGTVWADKAPRSVYLLRGKVAGAVIVKAGAVVSIDRGNVYGAFTVSTVSGRAAAWNSTLHGNVTVSGARKVALAGNRVNGSLKITGSRDVSLSRNTVLGNLSCSANSPAPAGSGNRVFGLKSGQCARLR